MSRITIRFDEDADSNLWAEIQSIPPGQRTAQLKRVLEAGFRLRGVDVLQRLDELERRMAEWESGIRTAQAPSPAPLKPAAGPAGTPPGWKESLTQLGAFED